MLNAIVLVSCLSSASHVWDQYQYNISAMRCLARYELVPVSPQTWGMYPHIRYKYNCMLLCLLQVMFCFLFCALVHVLCEINVIHLFYLPCLCRSCVYKHTLLTYPYSSLPYPERQCVVHTKNWSVGGCGIRIRDTLCYSQLPNHYANQKAIITMEIKRLTQKCYFK